MSSCVERHSGRLDDQLILAVGLVNGVWWRLLDGSCEELRVTGWTVVLPLKGGPDAKTRLGLHPDVATAIALDTLAGVLPAARVDRVLVVTADAGLARECRTLGATVVDQSDPAGGLTGAIEDGVRAAQGPCAVLLGDLPALRPDDLDDALKLSSAALAAALAAGAAAPMVFVPDAEGTGTVLLAALSPAALRPRFGHASADAHRAEGALRLELSSARLRRDVDTTADLEAALLLGTGPRTRAALTRAALA